MALPSLKSFAVAAGVTAASFMPAYAQDAEVTPVVATTTVAYEDFADAIDAAQDYSLAATTDGVNAIGVIVGYGYFDGAPDPTEVGEKFVSALSNRGVEAQYFIVNADAPGYAIAFALGDVGHGPMPVPEAIRQIDDIVASKTRLNELELSSLESN